MQTQTISPIFYLRVGTPEMILPINVDATTARRKVNGWCSDFAATSCGGRTPELVVKDGAAFWRVPIAFTMIGLGDVGEVGEAWMNAHTGEIQDLASSEQRGEAMRKKASELAKQARANGYTFQIRKAPQRQNIPEHA
jgi:hypothetical protein